MKKNHIENGWGGVWKAVKILKLRDKGIVFCPPGKSLTDTLGIVEWVSKIIFFFRCRFFFALKSWEWVGAKHIKEKKKQIFVKNNKHKRAKVPFFCRKLLLCCHSAKWVASILVLGRKIHLFCFSRIPRKNNFCQNCVSEWHVNYTRKKYSTFRGGVGEGKIVEVV